MKVLVIGYGSIGKRHVKNFSSLGADVRVLSRRILEDVSSYSDLDEAIKVFNPTHVVIANETSEHGPTLHSLREKTQAAILVEKPLYAFLPKEPVRNSDNVFVAYNLRFHPLVKKLKDALHGQKIVSWHAYVGQNLEKWRPGRDYTKVYSASKELGGGAIRDLSHEIDMFRYFAGASDLKAAHGGHFSKLNSTADDHYSVLLSAANCSHANIHMNCMDRIVQRFVTAHTEEESFSIDLISGRWRTSKSDENHTIDGNTSYVEMARAFLSGSKGELCTYQEAWETNVLIEKAERL